MYQDLLAGALCNLGIVLGHLGKSEESEQVERSLWATQQLPRARQTTTHNTFTRWIAP